MKRNFLPPQLKLIFAMAIMLLAAAHGFSQENQPSSQNASPLPPPTGFVNDYASVIDTATKQALEAKLKKLKETTNPGIEIAVAVVKTTGDRPIFDYSLAVARGWKIGSKADENPGALLFVAIDDRKYFTQVSKDLEDELPDGVVGTLQRQYLVPEFKKGNYAKGISDTIDAYIAAIQNKGTISGGTTPAKPVSGNQSGSGGAIFGLFCCGLIIFIILLIIFTRGKGGPTKNDRDRWGGGGFGSSGGGSNVAGNIASGIIGGLIGSALSGGSSSSDSGSSGGSDWGGFSGGGDFGGGGSGGDW